MKIKRISHRFNGNQFNKYKIYEALKNFMNTIFLSIINFT